MSDEETDVAQAVAGHIAEYRALREQIGALEDAAKEQHETVSVLLELETHVPGDVWPFPGIGIARLVNGRVTEKLDRARLAKAGVSAAVLDAATVRTEGKPTLRIEGWTGEA